ncbi:ImmA/IrrE family metallo-endopeptidase [Pseudaminobacter sp. 19-2017]|uniref:ImmA/IrrE family metallo-endopeptidase n=1 Tax=Pseudaminobacter soli (ex Zhang et al. 2022) TaxID=2831468 RepID=A0A942E178_9HYPH|nr:ImmA/IrrE family metallo-endopeptidase [Pseudaminobacter soli]MBS3651954.1 ImmA/IrrE family metallo-endopeptidase [Pseudaminobacter soli]
MSEPSPERWAIDLSLLLNAVKGADRFPVDIAELALEYSKTRFPGDPILRVAGDDLPGFDGALMKAPGGKPGWGIFYNNAFRSKGRINFTLAHELGHYLLHRTAYPDGFYCSSNDVVRWDSEYGQIEHQANVFAANILMPLDDYRRQIPQHLRVDLEMISACAERYRVSLIAASLRWLTYTTRRAILVCSRDGFILWAKPSASALKSGIYFRTSMGPIEIPGQSQAAKQDMLVDARSGIPHPAGVWFREPVQEMTVFSEQYDFVVSLLTLEDRDRYEPSEEPIEDSYDRFMNRQQRF